jgi:methylenetetrahydrofolate dehydrogenase (NADP+) / methenyltetrahydrofolate cyclohydrolase
MKTRIFDGKMFAKQRIDLAKIVIKNNPELTSKKLRVVLVGNSPASIAYVKLKKALFSNLGIPFEDVYFSKEESADKIVDYIKTSNNEPDVKAIMVQLPFPKGWSQQSKKMVLEAINPQKDVDCLTTKNLKFVSAKDKILLPATVKAVKLILETAGINKKTIFKLNVCILGKSDLVGRPLASLLSNMGANVYSCDSKTKNITEITKKSDILISATGVPKLVKKNMIKPGAIVIDVGEPKGDVDYNSVKNIASFITPVPGGVGPVTVVCLLENFISL